MSTELFRGELVRLTDENPDVLAAAFNRWNRDPEYFRLLDSAAPRLWSTKKMKDWFEKDLENPSPTYVSFSIRTLAEDKLIGFVAFDEVRWVPRDAWVAIGIGEREYWGKGCGTDAMRLMLRYGFMALNLNRVSLGVFATNPRAVRSYEKCGFVHEGCIREFLLRDGKYWDMFQMGILREDWEVQEKTKDKR